MRLTEEEARTLLLIRAVDDTDHDGVLLAPRTRAAATRRAFDEVPRATDDGTRLRTRAMFLRGDLAREAPALLPALEPVRSRRALVLAALAAAAAAGALTNLLGPDRRVSVLAFPLAGIVGWNCLVYLGLVLRLLGRVAARTRGMGLPSARLAVATQWLEGARLARVARRLGASTRSAAVGDAVLRFQRLWVATAAPLIAARVRVVLHLAAFATALGAIAGLYVSGIAFEYRATWESTWLDARAVQRYVDVVLRPASRVLDMPVPDVAPLRGPDRDGNAAPWIHLWATTLGLFVLVPRAALALGDALIAARRSRRVSVPLDAGYARRALHSGRGMAMVVEIVYYSCAPDAGLRERLHTMLQDRAGARAVIRDGARLDYGDGPERVAVPDDPSLSGMVTVVFALAQTPEAEVHGDFLARLQGRLDRAAWEIIVVLEMGTYRQRVGSDARVRERRATWDRLLRDLELTALELD